MAQFLCYYSMNPFNNINDKLSNIKNMLQQKLDQLSQSTQSIHHQLQAQIQSNITLLNQQFAGVIDQLALLNPVEKLKRVMFIVHLQKKTNNVCSTTKNE